MLDIGPTIERKQEKWYVFFCAIRARGEGCVSSEVDRGAGVVFVVFQEMVFAVLKGARWGVE